MFEMEKVETWGEESVISELAKGMELANELKSQIRSPISSRNANCVFLLDKIVSCYDNALSITNCLDLLENGERIDLLGSHSLIEGSPRSDVSDQDSKDQGYNNSVRKKRKTKARCSEQVHLCSGTGSEGQLDDGYFWRKYGQKDILGANHPRSYYRCTHRNTQGCLATKHVQQSDEDPSVYEVVYRAKHSCIQERLKLKKQNANVQMKQEEDQGQKLFEHNVISNIEPGLEVESENVETHEFFSDLDFLIDQVDLDSYFADAAEYF